MGHRYFYYPDHWSPNLLRCVDCEHVITVSESVAAGGSRCTLRRCKKCHASRKAVRSWFAKTHRTDEWDSMPVEKKRELVVQNKDKGCGKGHRRKIELTDEVKCKDMTRLQQDKPFMTKKTVPWSNDLCVNLWSLHIVVNIC